MVDRSGAILLEETLLAVLARPAGGAIVLEEGERRNSGPLDWLPVGRWQVLEGNLGQKGEVGSRVAGKVQGIWRNHGA